MEFIDSLMQNKVLTGIIWIVTTVFLIQQVFTQGFSLLKLRIDRPLWMIFIVFFGCIWFAYKLGEVHSVKEKDEKDYEIVRGEVFSNQHIEVDGKRFENCQFNSTTLVYNGYNGGNFNNCVYIGDVTWAFNGPASRTLSLLALLYSQDRYRAKVEQLLQNVRTNTVPRYPEINTSIGPFK